MATTLVPKVHINGKINTRMKKIHEKSMLNGPYMMINQLIKSIWKAAHLKNSLSYMLGGKNINPTKNN